MAVDRTIDIPFGGDPSSRSQKTSVNVGTANTGVTASEGGDYVNHVVTLTFTDLAVGSAVGAAALAFGKLLYTLPAGAQLIDVAFMNLALTGTVTIVADTPDVGIGSVIGSGANATLNAVGATSEDYITGQTSGAISGSNSIEVAAVATAGALTGIALNLSTDVKAIFLNVADTWAGAGDVTATGIVTISYKTLQ
ncbi:MAG: hypothetical protein GY861_05515 [bacterium]|nr:hypothetical protein [bacterium]